MKRPVTLLLGLALVPNIHLGHFDIVTSAHPLSLGPVAFAFLQTRVRDLLPEGVMLAARTVHLGPVQAVLQPER